MSARTAYRIKTHKAQKPPVRLLDRLLDPIEGLAETIYSILILLTFTAAYRIFSVGSNPSQPIPDDYGSDLLIAAFGAVAAWGVIDGIMHVLLSAFERGEKHRLLQHVRAADSEQEAVDAIADELDFILDPITTEEDRQALYREVHEYLRDDGRTQPVGFRRADFVEAATLALLAVVVVLPALAPFVLLPDNVGLAIRLSNVISFVMLFVAGYRWGKYTGGSPWKTGLVLSGVAVLMVAVAIPLGG
jgi:VIT1/CCC1 family predicted Fe2+/Mn2+ transporter